MRDYAQHLGDYAETIVSRAMSEATGLDARVDWPIASSRSSSNWVDVRAGADKFAA